MKTNFTSKEFAAILVLELKKWSDDQQELRECLLNKEAIESNCGITSSFGQMISKAAYNSEFMVDEEEESYIEEYCTHVDTIEYLQNMDQYERKEVLAKSLNILEKERALVEGLDQEIIDLYAEQKLDLEKSPFYKSNNVSSDISLQVQRLSNKGHWYSIGEAITLDVEDIFDINQNVFTTKMVAGVSVIEALMKLHNVERSHFYSNVNSDGEIQKVYQEQRVLVRGQLLKAGVEIDGVRLHSTVAPFRYSCNEDGVLEKPTYYMDQNVVEFCDVNDNGDYRSLFAVIPATDDESNGDAAILEFNNEIQYGKNIANQAMMSDESTDAIIEINNREEARAQAEGSSARRNALTNKDVRAIKDSALMASSIGTIAKFLVTKSCEAKFSRKAEIEFIDELNANLGKVEEILSAIEAHKRLFGKGLEYKDWKRLDSIVKVQKNKKFAELVESHIIENIANLNKGHISVSDLDDETLIEIREASVKYGRFEGKRTACWISDADVSNTIKLRYASIKNLAV
jgi:hypothetical protein